MRNAVRPARQAGCGTVERGARMPPLPACCMLSRSAAAACGCRRAAGPPFPHIRCVSMFLCLAGLDPSDRVQFKDGTHLTRAGQRVWLECMRPAVQPLLAGNSTAAEQ